MTYFRSISILILCGLTCFGQDSIKSLEFGSTLVTMNSMSQKTYFAQDRSPFEFINGLFFRYKKNRLAFRAMTSYSDNYSEFRPPLNWIDAQSGYIHNKDFRIGIGGQFSLVKKNWFYIFADISYRHLISTGEYSGGINGAYDKYLRKSNGVETLPGLGFKFKLFNKLYLSPEIGLNGSFKHINATNTSVFNGHQTKYSYIEFLVNPIARLQLTFRL